MKLALSLLFMGIVGNGTAFRPAPLQLRRGSRDGRLPSGRTGTRPDSGFVQMPSFTLVAERDLPRMAMTRYARAQNWFGRFLLDLEADVLKFRAACWQQGPDAIKRGFDILVSLSLLLLLSPVFLLIAIFVKMEDGGPVFFAQTRVGRHGREFKMFKVRSMCLNAEQKLQELMVRNQHSEGVTFKIKDDPRITRVGRWLRKFSLDELPQFYNVLMGDMSLVGPRPPVPREVAKYSLADRRRLAVKPGITCIWQISGRSEIDFSGQVQLDVNYIETRSFLQDLKLLVLTVPAVISGKGAC
jgi:exopolysaccharide biosynthesis polyprenyl glycosylphosphotransferase